MENGNLGHSTWKWCRRAICVLPEGAERVWNAGLATSELGHDKLDAQVEMTELQDHFFSWPSASTQVQRTGFDYLPSP